MDLSLVTTEAILDEIRKRFDHVLLAGIVNHDSENDQSVEMWEGNPAVVIGLGSRIVYLLNRELDAHDTPVDEL